MEPILKVKNLTKVFSRSGQENFTAVSGICFDLRPGECLGIIGESGSGKTTAVNLITRLLDVTEGSILLEGAEITHLKGKELRKGYRKMQMVFQTPTDSFDPRRTLGDGIGESLRNIGMSRKETRKEVERLLGKCGLSAEFADRYPHQVSGGQCQRAAIARALAVKPGILICDEATSALDVTVQKEILELLNELRSQQGNSLSILFICHDISLVRAMSHRTAIMYLGNILEVVPGKQLGLQMSHPYTKALKSSLFSVDMDFNEPLEILESEAPSPLDIPTGCPFRNRCRYVQKICATEKPVLRTLEPGHQIACHLFNGFPEVEE